MYNFKNAIASYIALVTNVPHSTSLYQHLLPLKSLQHHSGQSTSQRGVEYSCTVLYACIRL